MKSAIQDFRKSYQKRKKLKLVKRHLKNFINASIDLFDMNLNRKKKI